MAKLLVRDDMGTHVFEFEDQAVVGSQEGCDVRVPHKDVAPRHCRLYREGASYVLEQIGSDKYTLCNNRIVTSMALHDGDTIVVGTVRLVFREDLTCSRDPDLFGASTPPADTKVESPHAQHLDVAESMTDESRRLLTNCGVCGRAVRRDAGTCPACGAEIVRESDKRRVLPKGQWSFMDRDFREIGPLCFERLVRHIDEGDLRAAGSVRGPTTDYHWFPANQVLGTAKYFGVCQDCGARVDNSQRFCQACGQSLDVPAD